MGGVNRRDFMKFATVVAGGAALGDVVAWASLPERQLLLIGDGDRPPERQIQLQKKTSAPGAALVFDLKSYKKVGAVSLKFIPHGFTQHPKIKNQVFAFEKWGPHFAWIDLEKLTVLRAGKVDSPLQFFGHGVAHENKVYASAMDLKNNKGLLTVIGPSGEIEKYLPSNGLYPHDCKMDSGHLVVMNFSQTRGVGSKLSWIDPKSGHVVKEIRFENPKGGYSHFERWGEKGWVAVGSTSLEFLSGDPLVAVLDETGHVKTLAFPSDHEPKPRGEALSVAVGRDDVVAVTVPLTSRVYYWNARTQKYLGDSACGTARAVVWNEQDRRFAILCPKEERFKFFDLAADLQKPFEASPELQAQARGSHFYKMKI